MSYTIEVYRHNQKAERNPLIFALYVMFYPQLVAGPIERPYNLLPQLRAEHDFDYQRVTDGLKLMAWGMFKKTVIADQLADFVNAVYGAPTEYSGVVLMLATVCFAVQIYCDFSGYSDIAIGTAQVMGIRLMTNFRCPYAARSVREFWTRWHISLSTWFRDYVYIPLGGNRVSTWRWQFNLMATFLLSGLWHGARWNFIVWGALNGFYMLFSHWTKEIRSTLARWGGLDRYPRLLAISQRSTTFFLICCSWIYFRANNMDDAWLIVTRMVHGVTDLVHPNRILASLNYAHVRSSLFSAIIGLIALGIIEHLQESGFSIRAHLAAQPLWFRWSLYYVLVMATLLFGVHPVGAQFIYFQF